MDVVDLVKKASHGDRDALISLVMNKKSEYYKLAYVYMGNKEDAMDAMEDMIVILHENIKKLKKQESFYSWSKTILVNCCKNIIRRNKKFLLVDDYKEIEFIENYTSREQTIDLESALKRLKPNQQEAIRLRYFMDLDYESIASLTKAPMGTVKSRISIGLKKLKEIFGGENYEEC